MKLESRRSGELLLRGNLSLHVIWASTPGVTLASSPPPGPVGPSGALALAKPPGTVASARHGVAGHLPLLPAGCLALRPESRGAPGALRSRSSCG